MLPEDLINIISEYSEEFKLRDWIPLEKLHWDYLSKNKNAIDLLEKNVDKIDWYWLSQNKNAVNLLEKYPDNINWVCLSENKNAIHLLEKNLDKE